MRGYNNHIPILSLLTFTPLLTSALPCRACKNGHVLCSELVNLVFLLAIFFGREAGVFQNKRPDLVDILVVLNLSFDLHGRVELSFQYLRNNTVEMMKYLDCQGASDTIFIYQVVERLRERFTDTAGTIELVVFGIHR